MTRGKDTTEQETEQPPAYEAPTLTPIGTVDEAVAGVGSYS